MKTTSANLNHSDNSFVFLRVIAAWAVLYSHSYALVGLPEPQPIAGQSFGSLAVALFFAISGFLVCQSWNRDPSIIRFAARRILRIMPGLFTVILFTVFIIGPVFSVLPATEYIAEPRTLSYIPSTLLLLSVPTLPGLFETNPYPNSNNGSLWTLRYEVLMYACLAIVGNFIPRTKLKAACIALFVSFAAFLAVLVINELTPFQIPYIWRLSTQFYSERIGFLGAFFFAGCCAYLFLARIPLSLTLALALIVVTALIPNKNLAMSILWLVIPYTAISFAYRAPRIFHRINGYDYSYGIYIYAFPIQQVVAHLISNPKENWLTCLVVSTIATIFFACLSWHFIEKPALGLKKRLIRRPPIISTIQSSRAS